MPQNRNPRVRRRVLLAPCVGLTEEGSPTASTNEFPMRSGKDDDSDADQPDGSADDSHDDAKADNPMAEEGDFGDDFDDFEEGGDGDDFGDFDDGFQQADEHAETTFDKPPDPSSVPAPSPGPVSQLYSIPGKPFCRLSVCLVVMCRLT